jgi:hypothetical protein
LIYSETSPQEEPTPESAEDNTPATTDQMNIQKYLTLQIHQSIFIDMLKKGTERDKARILSAGGPGSSGFITALPSEPSLYMTNDQMVTAMKLRLGLPVLPTFDGIPKCSCSNHLDALGDHILVCKKGPEVIHRHNSIVRSWERLILQTSHTSLFLERTLGGLGMNVDPNQAGKKADLIEFEQQRKPLLADISVIHATPTSAINLKKYAKEKGAAARAKELQKKSKYGAAANALEMDFSPLVMETYGRLGEEALKYARRKITEYVQRITQGKQDRGLTNRTQTCHLSTQQ